MILVQGGPVANSTANTPDMSYHSVLPGSHLLQGRWDDYQITRIGSHKSNIRHEIV